MRVKPAGFLVLLFCLAGCDLMFENPYAHRPFDSAQWKAYKDQRDNKRYEMLDDLVANHLPLGMERAAVLEILGPPDSEDTRYQELMYNTATPEASLTSTPRSFGSSSPTIESPVATILGG